MAEYSARFFQPERLEEVPAILAGLTCRSVILAGGTDLLIKLRDKCPEIDSWMSLCRLTAIYLPLTDGMDSCFKKLGSRADIAQIRMNRKKPSKLKFTPAEQQYKERAVRGLLCDLAALINQR